jgi:hypothetical protein
MENHWKSRFILGEFMLGKYMISPFYTEVVIGDTILALFEDTKFYKINYYTSGLFRFGKIEDVLFLKKKCLYEKRDKALFYNEFCINKGETFCFDSHISNRKILYCQL